MAKKIIEIKDVTKSFDGAVVVKGISLDVIEGSSSHCSGRPAAARRRR